MEISEISQIVEKASRIIYYGLLNPKKLSTNVEYQTLYEEYIINSELKAYVKSITKGLEINIITIERDGIYLSPEPNSPYAPKSSDIPVLGKEKNKGLFALIMVAVAAYFFPTPQSFATRGFDKHINKELLHDFIKLKIEDMISVHGDEILNVDSEKPGIVYLLSQYNILKKTSDKNTQSTAFYFIEKTLNYLKTQRLLALDGKNYIPTIKFRYQMEEFSNNSNYLDFVQEIRKNSSDLDHKQIDGREEVD